MWSILTKVITFLLIVLTWYLWYQGYIYYNINQKWVVESNKIRVELPPFYDIWINDTLLSAFLLKTWYFQFDKNLTYDGIFNKDWIPLSYNFCNSKVGSDIYTINDDIDKDWLTWNNDKFPFDYSNGDATVRNSESLDFDSDGIPNKLDMDADGNWVPDVYQALCFDWVNDKTKEQRRWLWGNEWNKMISDAETYKERIRTFLKSKIPNQEILDADGFELGINAVYQKLLYTDEIIYSIDGKNYRIGREDILNETQVLIK